MLAPRFFKSARRGTKPRIFLGPIEIAGYYAGLEMGLREIGVDAVFVDLEPHPLGYGRTEEAAEVPIAIVTWIQRLQWRRRHASGPPIRRYIENLCQIALRSALTIWAVLRFDVFVFGYGSTPLHLAELPLLRFTGKRLIFVFHGSDERPPYLDGAVAPGLSPIDLARKSQELKHRLRRIGKYAEIVISNPSSTYFWDRPVIAFQAVGCAIPALDHPARRAKTRTSPFRILHAPSDPVVKGTASIRAAMAAMVSDGFDIDYQELQGVQNAVVIEAIAQADLVIDQLYSDTTLSRLAGEAVMVGTPVLVCGYAWDFLSRTLPEGPPWPLTCPPEDLESTVRAFVVDQQRGPERSSSPGRQSSWQTPPNVARRFRQVVDGTFPRSWTFDPSTLTYPYGGGLSSDTAARLIRSVVDVGGVSALCLDDKPVLCSAVLNVGRQGDC